MKKGVYVLLLCMIAILSSCNGNATGNEHLDYEQTKKMLVDILKTDDGKKAIRDILSDEEMKAQLVMEQAVIRKTIEENLTSEKGKEFWKKSFADPKFAKSIAESMKIEHEELLKDLMKDPEYQGMVIDILKDPETQKDLTQAFKSKDFREHLQNVISETLESPIFKAKIQDILLEAADEKEKKKEKDKMGGDKESGGQGGDE